MRPKLPSLIVAPMAGISNPEFVIASSRAGALGSFGFAYTAPEKIARSLREVKNKHLPVNANFFIFQPIDCPFDVESALSPLRAALPEIYSQQITGPPMPPYFPDLDAQLEAIWETTPSCLSFHFGIPPERVIERAKALGITVGMSATSPAEALEVARSGADYVVLQGFEAGGHRGTFLPNDPSDECLSALDLYSRVRSSLSQLHPTLQFVVAGGIMTRADVRHTLSLGADAVQLGTVFIPSRECPASLEYKNALLGYSTRPEPWFPSTILTTAWSGRQARCLPNQFTDSLTLSSSAYAPLPFPVQNSVTQRVRESAKTRHESQFQSLYAGQRYYKCRDMLSDSPSTVASENWREVQDLPSVAEIVRRLDPRGGEGEEQ
jgi:nitronate monooxygenase